MSGATRSVDLERPFLDFGVPFRFRDWDLDFIAWLNRTGKHVDFLTDDDLEAFRPATSWPTAYDLVVFPGHAEYVTEHEYDVVQRYRDRRRQPHVPLREQLLLEGAARRPAADEGGSVAEARAGPRRRSSACSSSRATTAGGRARTSCTAPRGRSPAPGSSDGDRFGQYGFEIDARSPQSPPGTQVLASIPNLMGPGRTAEMTYYETPGGAKVFAAGALNFTASIGDPAVAQLVENVWTRLSAPNRDSPNVGTGPGYGVRLGVVVEAAAGLAAQAAFGGHLP